MTIYLLSLFCIHTLYLFLLSLRCILASLSPPSLSTSTISLHHSPVSMPPYILPLCIFLAFRCIYVPRLYPFPTVYCTCILNIPLYISPPLFQYIHTHHIPVSTVPPLYLYPIPVPPLYLYLIYLSLLCIYTLYTCPSSVSISYIRAVSPDCVGGRGKVGLAGPVWAAPNLIIILIPGMPHASSPGYLSRYTQLSPPVSSPVASYTQLPINPRKLSCSQLHGYHPLKLSCSQLSPAAQLSPPVSSPVTSYTQLSTPESSPVASYTAITP